ncbi:hypothetical protein GCM10008917_10750 [Paraclostridium tenue]|uniref:Uncharacterized protein n=1 Tax=Paraclostridium tenue TaxID=1737 RepID=A0ABP3XBL2_9FIRM
MNLDYQNTKALKTFNKKKARLTESEAFTRSITFYSYFSCTNNC